MNSSGIDFIIVSWWGMDPYDYGQQAPVDNAVRTLYSVANLSFPNIKIAIMVEGFNEDGSYDFNYIKNYIYKTFYSAYPNEMFFLDNSTLPLLCWWNAPVMTNSTNRPLIDNDNDSLFCDRIVGQSYYVDWFAWQPGYGDPDETPFITNDSVVVIEPRYDGSYINLPNSTFDQNYSEHLYDNQWSFVLNNQDKISYVIIYSWNEYHERSEIEPNNDSTSISENPYYILNKTEFYIEKLSIPEFSPLLVLPIFMFTTLLVVIIHRRKTAEPQKFLS
jgi:hypothetical protein